uniref:Uncharacterized protein n=1 Tax=Rhizophora mucronata TaxID=61149 RepID=A0A2P2NYE2_RHIMU
MVTNGKAQRIWRSIDGERNKCSLLLKTDYQETAGTLVIKSQTSGKLSHTSKHKCRKCQPSSIHNLSAFGKSIEQSQIWQTQKLCSPHHGRQMSFLSA